MKFTSLQHTLMVQKGKIPFATAYHEGKAVRMHTSQGVLNKKIFVHETCSKELVSFQIFKSEGTEKIGK